MSYLSQPGGAFRTLMFGTSRGPRALLGCCFSCQIESIRSSNTPGFRSLKSRVKVLVDGTLLIPNLVPEDAGNYTCIPTNGILTPPSASASLTVKRKRSSPQTRVLVCHRVRFTAASSPFPSDPARVGRMPRETYLPTGMGGVIVCPVQANPPALYVNWTKDGNDLNPDNVRDDGRRGKLAL